MASSATRASSTAPSPLQIAVGQRFSILVQATERWLEAERDQLFLWLPVMLGAGVIAWLLLPDPAAWAGALLLATGGALVALAIGRGGRVPRVIAFALLGVAAGIVLIWTKAERVADVPLARPAIVMFEAEVERIDPLPPRGLVRLRLAPTRMIEGLGRSAPDRLPRHLRVNLSDADMPAGLETGAIIRLGARLVPPPPPSVPGAYDYARAAWFDRIGATGRGFGPVIVVARGNRPDSNLRATLSRHIRQQMAPGPGAIAAALATGDQGAIPVDDADAMRRAGLTHLLSVSGLHITAVVGATMLLVMRVLALSGWLALRTRLPLIAAGAGALAAIGYTILTGAEVPTIRSCVAALMVLLAVAMGREALTLRLVASGAIIVLLFWPEAIAGPSFQLSFAAVTAIIALHETPRIRALFAAREEGRVRWLMRQLASLLLTGIVVEAALAPIALFHFHKAGLYGSLANIVAIPLTTFVVMPLEALALLFDLVGAGRPLWWLVELALLLLLGMAHVVAGIPGAVSALPAMPGAAFGLMVAGGLWLALWRTRARLLGCLPFALGAGWAVATPPPDLLVTNDGRHVAIQTPGGDIALLRDRAGDYTRTMLAENGGVDGEPLLLSDQPNARCSRDICVVDHVAGPRTWRIVATRSNYLLSFPALRAVCSNADIMISERRLPQSCRPRWLRLDRSMLAQTGGIAITLSPVLVRTVRQQGDAHPWIADPYVPPATRRRAIRRYDPGRPDAQATGSARVEQGQS